MNKEIVTIWVPIDEEEIMIQIAPALSQQRESLWEIGILEAKEQGEATLQILEGCSYEYKVTGDYYLGCIYGGVVHRSSLTVSAGRITPNTYVGTLTIDILKLEGNKKCGEFQLEVRSVKATYREDYKQMLEEIAEKCTELIMQANSPISQYFTADFYNSSITLYQRFAFIKAVLDSDEFNNALYKIFSAPVTRWTEGEIEKDIRAVKRINSKVLRRIANNPNRINLPEYHKLYGNLSSIPSKVQIVYKRETVDTPENRFIKYALGYFLHFFGDFIEKLKDSSKHKKEALQLVDQLSHFLGHSIFQEVSSLSSIPFNSPILQRKEGYREVFRTWLMFDLTAKLIWEAGEDVYEGGKKDVARLYEYWLFFKLLDAVIDIFGITPPGVTELIEVTKDGLSLKLRQGKPWRLEGVFDNNIRKLNVKFSYNRTFSGNNQYPNAGSWTSTLRPDYTLSIWPHGVSEDMAEKEELIVHIHFDAKYKIETIDLDNEAGDKTLRRTYGREDLLKMHTYRDAIRRTAGAYILYPGTVAKRMIGFHEILPGIGAFAIPPSKDNSGIYELKIFLNEIVNHFLNRASQRERVASKIYEIHKEKSRREIYESLPEGFGANRLVPDEIFVLIGYYKNDAHLKWIIERGLYNARFGMSKSSPNLKSKEISAKYLLLYTRKQEKSPQIFKLKGNGPRIFSKADLRRAGYPSSPTQNFYLIFELEKEPIKEFQNSIWDIKKIKNDVGEIRTSTFAICLSDMMKALVKSY